MTITALAGCANAAAGGDSKAYEHKFVVSFGSTYSGYPPVTFYLKKNLSREANIPLDSEINLYTDENCTEKLRDSGPIKVAVAKKTGNTVEIYFYDMEEEFITLFCNLDTKTFDYTENGSCLIVIKTLSIDDDVYQHTTN